MSDSETRDGDTLEYKEKPVSEVLAEITGRPASDFSADEYPHPNLEDLKSAREE